MDGAPEAACHLVWLDPAPASRTHVGGKSSSLSQLSVLGAPVPPAFAITTHTYAQFAASLNLPRQASDVADEDLPRLRALIMGAALPGPVTESIVHGYRAFQTLVGREVALAVRSARTLTPPPFTGAAPPEPPPTGNPMERANARFFGGPPQQADTPGQLKGNAGCRGVATGIARVARTLEEATRVLPGEILVAVTTMPAWTPLFGIAAAVVTETGGPLSHCAIVAREYGIPAVVGAYGATRAITTGQRVTVDRGTGIVTLNA